MCFSWTMPNEAWSPGTRSSRGSKSKMLNEKVNKQCTSFNMKKTYGFHQIDYRRRQRATFTDKHQINPNIRCWAWAFCDTAARRDYRKCHLNLLSLPVFIYLFILFILPFLLSLLSLSVLLLVDSFFLHHISYWTWNNNSKATMLSECAKSLSCKFYIAAFVPWWFRTTKCHPRWKD